MMHDLNNPESRLDSLLRADALGEMAGTDPMLADRMIAGLRDARRRPPAAWIAGTGLCVVAVVIGAIAWPRADRTEIVADNRPTTPVLETEDSTGLGGPILTMIDSTADDLIEPLRREFRVLADLTRDSWRSIAGFAPIETGR